MMGLEWPTIGVGATIGVLREMRPCVARSGESMCKPCCDLSGVAVEGELLLQRPAVKMTATRRNEA